MNPGVEKITVPCVLSYTSAESAMTQSAAHLDLSTVLQRPW